LWCLGSHAQEPAWTFQSPKAQASLRKFEAAHQKLKQNLEQSRSENRAALIASLEACLKAATTAGELDEAVAIRDAIKVLKSEAAPASAPAESEPANADPPDVADQEEPERPADSRIPANAVAFRGHHYLRVEQEVSWPVAVQMCKTQGGHLVRMETAEEYAFVRDQILKDTKGACWIDGVLKGGGWFYTNGKRIRKMAWARGEPNNVGGKEFFITTSPGGEWSDVPASPSRLFICEWDR